MIAIVLLFSFYFMHLNLFAFVGSSAILKRRRFFYR